MPCHTSCCLLSPAETKESPGVYKRDHSTETNRDNKSGSNDVTVAWLNAQSIRRKTTAVYDVLTDQLIDVFAITETWHRGADDVCLRTATPRGYLVADVAREKGTGGGVVFYRSQYKCATVDFLGHAVLVVRCWKWSE